MAVKVTKPSITTPVVIATNPAGNELTHVITVEVNNTSANSVFVGGPDVLAAGTAGRTVPTLTKFGPVTLYPGDVLYAAAGSASVIEVFATGA